MATLKTKIKLYLEANSKNYEDERDNIFMQDDGSGPYIKTWSVSGLDKPNDSQLTSYETAGNTLETNNNVRLTRKLAYGRISDQLDLLYKDLIANKLDSTGEWAKKIKAVKDANPKG
jgi:deoxyribodipyrimidine photolyase